LSAFPSVATLPLTLNFSRSLKINIHADKKKFSLKGKVCNGKNSLLTVTQVSKSYPHNRLWRSIGFVRC
jgi:hypothetical protein